jgi:hypothetical protein
MPGYGNRMEKFAPSPSEGIKTVEKRFVMPKITLVQIILVLVIIAYAYAARKMNGVVVGSIALTVALLHFYDHMFLIKRGSEKALFVPTREKYVANRAELRKSLETSLERSREKYTCQSCK